MSLDIYISTETVGSISGFTPDLLIVPCSSASTEKMIGRRCRVTMIAVPLLVIAVVITYWKSTDDMASKTKVAPAEHVVRYATIHTKDLGQNQAENIDTALEERNNAIPPLPQQFVPLSEKTVNGVEKFVFFIGHGRSGHSIIGSMMDAHPDMVIAHEYMLFHELMRRNFTSKWVLFNELSLSSYEAVKSGLRSPVNGSTQYMNVSWQGKFRNLKVIGDKSGGNATRTYSRFPTQFTKAYARLVEVVQMPIRVLHVIRNPFDVITTRLLYHKSPILGLKVTSALNIKEYTHTRGLEKEINDFFREVQAEADMIQPLNLTVFEIHHADFIKDPETTIRSICKFLDIECPIDYVQACRDKTHTSNSRSRDSLVWTEKFISNVTDRMSKFSFFRRYSFYRD